MAITFDANRKIFTIHTKQTTYQMQADANGYLLHLYYGARTKGSMNYLLCYADHGFSGNPYVAGMDRTYSLDALPQEYPSLGTGDYRGVSQKENIICRDFRLSGQQMMRQKRLRLC